MFQQLLHGLFEIKSGDTKQVVINYLIPLAGLVVPPAFFICLLPPELYMATLRNKKGPCCR